MLAPGTPYLFAAYFPRELIPLILNGRARFVVSVEVAYKDAAGEPYCYHMDFRYYAPTKTFDPAGRSDSCTENQSRPAVRKGMYPLDGGIVVAVFHSVAKVRLWHLLHVSRGATTRLKRWDRYGIAAVF